MKRCLQIALTIILCGVLSLTAFAKTSIEHDYIVNNENETISIPVTHECIRVIHMLEGYVPENGDAGKLNNPQDIFIDTDNTLYIADTGNNAVLKLDSDGRLLASITEADGIPLNYPLGIYVDKDKDIFVADNGNKRILHLDSQGEFIESFVAPETELLSQNLTSFDPSKIGVSSYNGYIYMLIGKEFLTLDALNRFQGLVGTEPVGFNFIDLLVRTFATELQKSKLTKREPVSFNNFCMTANNKIYAVSMANSNQIKKINAIGDSTYPSGIYGEMNYDEKGKAIYPFLVDIAVNSYEMITVADQHSSKLYQYNTEGELLTVFGGNGDSKGQFVTISSIAYDNKDNLYVLDSSRNTVQVMKPTPFMTQVHKATSSYLNGNYESSLNEWNTMRQLLSSYPVAQNKIANILYKQGDYAAALTEYYNAGNKSGYGKTLRMIRNGLYAEHFALISLVSIALAIGVVFLFLYLKRRSLTAEDELYEKSLTKSGEMLRMGLLVCYHPVRMLDLLKWKRPSKNYLSIVLLPILLILVRIVASYFTGFTVSAIQKTDVSIGYEVAMVLIPFITFGFSAYAITSVFSGEMTLYETFSAIAYSCVPVIILQPVLVLLSRWVTDNEAGIYSTFLFLLYGWMVINIVCSVYRLNDISLNRTLGLLLLSIIGTLIVWVLCLLAFTFSAQLWHFVKEVYKEIRVRFL